MNKNFYDEITKLSLQNKPLSKNTAQKIIQSEEIDILPLLNSAFQVRKKYFKKEVLIHILNNAQNGSCSENCTYCAQSKSSKAKIKKYYLKSEKEILSEARTAYEKGAYRYCLVFSGKGPSLERINKIADIIRKIKSAFKIEVCVSPGIIDEKMVKILKNAGLNRLNHNINTSPNHYKNICSTHSFADRLNTIKAAKSIGLQVCSGVIIGMGERAHDIIEMAYLLNKFKVESIPVNFFMPIDGIALKSKPKMTPEYCLRILCLFRLLNPKAEIRVSAGREFYLKELQALAFYPANSLFLEGYLNARGGDNYRTLSMLNNAGFTIKSEYTLDDLLKKEFAKTSAQDNNINEITIKNLSDLRPAKK